MGFPQCHRFSMKYNNHHGEKEAVHHTAKALDLMSEAAV